MNKLFKIGSRALLGAMVCGCSYFAPAAAQDDMAAFREALTMPTTPDTRVLRENVSFFVPMGQARLDFMAQAKKERLCMAGAFDVHIYDNDGGNITEQIPFYIEQDKKDMAIYYNFGGTWSKFEAPSLAAVVADIIATPESKDIEEEIALVKDVKVVRESDTQRTMFVRLDSDKVAEAVQSYSKENPADKGTADDGEFQNRFMRYLDTGIRNADISYMWTVDKKNWQTITQSVDISGVIRETAKAALNDNAAAGNPGVEEILETIAYFSDTKEYTVFLSPKAEEKLVVPQEVKKAAVPATDMIEDGVTKK